MYISVSLEAIPEVENKINSQYDMIEFQIDYKIEFFKRKLDDIGENIKNQIAESKQRIQK
jgi:hypothetical protein